MLVADLRLICRLDELHLEHPIAGVRILRYLCAHEGVEIVRKLLGMLIRKMGIEFVCSQT